jgi:hypothetical protein
MQREVQIDYTNWRGERSLRVIEPHELYHGVTQHHREPQLLLRATDLEKRQERVFAVNQIHHWDGPVTIFVKAMSNPVG